MESIITIKNLKKYYNDGKVKALDGVDLEVRKGEIFGLLGPNGAGKSTLINVLTTLANKTEGSITIAGIDFSNHPDKAKEHLGIVPQEFNFNIFEKVEDIVVQQGGYYGIPKGEAKKRAEKYLKKLGLWEKRHTIAMQLSGGMKRRLMIVRALIHEPEILILDEPSAGVDVELRREMWNFVQELHADGVTIILTTHYLEEAEMLCDRVAIINQGKILEVGYVKDLLAELQKDTLVLDLLKEISKEQVPDGFCWKDSKTLEYDLMKGETLNACIKKLEKAKIDVIGIRNKSNRLEELFVNKVFKK